jgi:hypothetical protein
MSAWLDSVSVPDAGAYLARLVRLDPTALVRLRPLGDGVLALWAWLPFEVLVTRGVRGSLAQDATVRAADLLQALEGELPGRHDAAWRWPLPSDAGRIVERIPVAEVRRLGAAAESTLRAAVTGGVRGRAVGERVLRDALLDHVPVVVITDDGARVEVPQRLVQAVVRMGFLGASGESGGGASGESGGGASGDSGAGDTPGTPETPTMPAVDVEVRSVGRWVGLSGPFGTGWFRPLTGLDVRPVR